MNITEDFQFNGTNISTYVTDNGFIWLHGTEVCKVLALKNPTLVLERHVSLKHRRQIAVGVGMPAWYVTEPGLYQLTFRSKSAMAEKFRDWVFEEVLPSIRKQGFYLDKQALAQDSEKLALLESETAILKQENFALKQYIDDVPSKINQAKQVGIEQGKIMVTEQAKVEATIDWQCETDVGDDPILFVKELRQEKLELQAKYDELNSGIYQAIKNANTSRLKTQLMMIVHSLD